MKHTLVCFIFLTALQDGNTGLVKAETLPRRAEEGGNITVACNFNLSGSRKLFCKETCDSGGILVETSDDAAQNGRYSIQYEKTYLTSFPTLYVSITQLKQSDSGWYRCSLARNVLPDGNDDFELIVTEVFTASTTSTPNGTLRPFSASAFLSSASTPPTTQSLSSTSGSSTPSSASSESSDVLIYVGLILVVMFVVLSAALLIFCMKRRTTKPRGPPVETDTQANWLYEEIRECDVPSGSPLVGVSSVYDYPKGPGSDGDESGGIYSLVTSPQSKVEDHSHNLCYTEVDFSHRPDTNSAPCGNAADAVHSASSPDLSTTKDASPPVYSTVTAV